MPLIEICGLTKLYRMGESIVRALDGVDLAIERGEFLAITGPSGSGKSTVMHLLGCLDRPTGGKYFFDGRDVSDLSDRELADVRNRQIGFVFQTFNLINRQTAAENVGVPLFYARRTALREPALAALQRVGLEHRAMHQPNELSGGERQRVAIARSIVNNPLLLLADEPTGNLDTRTGEQIMDIFRGLNEQGVTIIIVTHEQEIAEQARRIVHMRDGKIVSDRLTRDILAEEGRSRARKIAAAAEPEPPAGVLDVRDVPPSTPSMALTARLAPFAKGAFLCSLIGVILWAVCITAQSILGLVYGKQLQPPAPGAMPVFPPLPVIVIGLSSVLGMLAALVLSILGVVFAAKARKHMRFEPGTWLGRRRALAGLIMGWIGIATPVVLIVISVAAKLLKAG